MAKKVAQAFAAFVKVSYDLYVPVKGATLEEALAEARTLDAKDLVDTPEGTDMNDWETKLEGVHVR